MEKIKIDIWSDFVCPFCYMGRKKLEEALKALDLWGKVEMTYRSLELDKSLDRDTNTVRQLAKNYHMPIDKAELVMEKTQAEVEQAGLVYHYKKAISANTFNAHRLNYYAQSLGKGEEMTKAIMQAHFAQGQDISDLRVLANLGEKLGLDPKEIRSMFSSDRYKQEIEADRKMAGQLKIDVVPTYIINDYHRISGALSAEDYRQWLKKVTSSN